MRKPLMYAAILLLFLSLVGCQRGAQQAAAPQTIRGEVTAVQPSQNELTVSYQSQGRQRERTINVNASTEIYSQQGQKTTLAQVQVGDRVEVRTSRQHGRWVASRVDVLSTTAQAPGAGRQIQGQVTAVDQQQHTITVSQAGQAPQTVSVPAGTPITNAQGQTVNLSQVKQGSTVTITASPQQGQLVASQVNITAGPGERVAGAQQTALQGNISAVDTRNNTITVTPAGGGQAQTVEVPPGTNITRRGEQIDITDLQPGTNVQVLGSEQNGQLVASQVQVVPPPGGATRTMPAGAPPQGAAQPVPLVQGRVVSVDAQSGTITLRPASGNNQQVMVPDAVPIVYQGRNLDLSALRPGALVQVHAVRQNGRLVASRVQVSALPGQTAAAPGASGGQQVRLQGQVSAVQAAQQMIVLSPQGTAQVSLPARVRVMRQGKSARFSDLKPGDHVLVVADRSGGKWMARVVDVVLAPPAGSQVLAGPIRTVNARDLITMQPSGGSATRVRLASNTTIMDNGRRVQASSLQQGDQVLVLASQQGSQMVANRVLVIPSGLVSGTPNAFMGRVQNVNASQRTLTLALMGSERISVPPDARISYQGKSLPLSSLKQGSRVQVMALPQHGRLVATNVNVLSQPSAAVAGASQASITGTVKSVDLQARTLLIAAGQAGTRSISVPSGTNIVYQGRSLNLSQVRPGSWVTITASQQQGKWVASRIDVQRAAPARAAAR